MAESAKEEKLPAVVSGGAEPSGSAPSGLASFVNWIRQLQFTDLKFLGGFVVLAGCVLLVLGALLAVLAFLFAGRPTVADGATEVYYAWLWKSVGLPFLLLIIGIVCILVGRNIFESFDPSSRLVIPPAEFSLVSKLIEDEREKAIDLYLKLTTLWSFNGFFTGLGLTGFPLVTISLTVFFALFSLFLVGQAQSIFFFLSTLCLGAFIGSYVQRSGRVTADDVEEQRAVVKAGPPAKLP